MAESRRMLSKFKSVAPASQDDKPSGPGVLGAQSDKLQKVWPHPSSVELAEMEGGQSTTGLLIIDSTCTLQSFSRRLAHLPVSHFT